MTIRTLRLTGFRGHAETHLSFSGKTNLFFGPNGAGKTNILEAVHYLCLSKSFLVSQDVYALRKDAPYFEIEGLFEGDRRPSIKVRLVFVPDEGKKVFINGVPLVRLSEVVGKIPVVVFSPADYVLTAGGPDERRRFLNNVISQARPVYLNDLLHYRRVLRQRNEYLSQIRKGIKRYSDDMMDSWNAQLVKFGSRIVTHRQRFVLDFSRYLQEAYRYIATIVEEPSMTYSSFVTLHPEEDERAVTEKYWQQIRMVNKREIERGTSLVGPHRDEIVLRINGMEVRKYASQGQHRTLGMSIKLANYFYLQAIHDEYPILLLDDVFDHLDELRSTAFLEMVKSNTIRQSLITAATRTTFDDAIPFGSDGHQCLRIVAGQIEKEEIIP